ncbi:glycosyltransferase family 87 protein [Aestuariimicrobium ganziense]|uniref:glycosyltransferase family 87 protein n=1 Tax=Aestuariimicrobium ganziense TaxID=2773677 RepID=UPI001943D053|nr:glycosyltransferase family 87 protein [Aestuariimicrobium ganziense]
MVRAWLVARAAVFAVWLLLAPSTQGDVVYYFRKIHAMSVVGPEQTLIEYPTPVVWLLSIPYWLGLRTQVGYVIAFVVIMLALDALFARLLWRTGGRQSGRAVLFWIVFLALIGPTAYLRFDLIPSVLGGAALVELVRRRQGLAGMLIGLGAAVKLWPALMWPALLGGPRKAQVRATVGVFGFGGLLALASLVWAGWDRLLSPLDWQSGRHLQVESIWASVPMLVRLFRPLDYWVGISHYQAFEIWGPGVSFMLTLASLSAIVGYLIAIVAYVMWLRRPRRRLVEAAVLMLMVVLVMIVTNKAFSPQYMIWLGGPLAAGFAILGVPDDRTSAPELARDERRLVRCATALMALTLMTQVVYPIGYAPLVKGSLGVTVVTLVLVVRNIGVVALLVWVLRWIWGFLRRPVEQ